MQHGNSYKACGVDIDAAEKLVESIKKFNPSIGGFSGLYPLGENYLVASTDGVGTKLLLAIRQGRHDSIGQDLVAMCVNDVITTGATPLFFLDYFATSSLNVQQAERVIEGIHRACQMAGCVLLGGETAEMPGFYAKGDYDLSGFCVGSVKKKELIDGSSIKVGDRVLGLYSSGLHSNGFSLVRSLLKEFPSQDIDFLTPTLIYTEIIDTLKRHHRIKGIAHITGGGLIENIPRILPKGLGVCINKNAWKRPKVFDWIQEKGKISDKEMYRTFNMGIGMVLILGRDDSCKLHLEHNLPLIGEVISGSQVVIP